MEWPRDVGSGWAAPVDEEVDRAGEGIAACLFPHHRPLPPSSTEDKATPRGEGGAWLRFNGVMSCNNNDGDKESPFGLVCVVR